MSITNAIRDIAKPLLIWGVLAAMPGQVLAIGPNDLDAVMKDYPNFDTSPAASGNSGGSCTALVTPTIVDKAGLVAAFEKFEQKRTGGKSPLRPYFGQMIDGAITAGWNPLLVLTQAQMESQLATDKSVYGLRAYNAWGRTAGSSQPGIVSPGGRRWYAWTSWTDALTGPDSISVYNVRKWIKEANYTTIEQYIMQYAPPSDGNDSAGYIKNIYAWIEEIVTSAGPALNCGDGPIGIGTGYRSSKSSKIPGKDTILPKWGFTLNYPGGNNMTYYNQCDSRWGKPNGYDICSGGCGPTNMAMIVSTLTKQTVTPTQMVAVQGPLGGLVPGGGTQNGDTVFVKIAQHYGLQGKYIRFDLNKARETIKAGGLVIASMQGEPFTTGFHYIVIRGITADNKLLVANSLTGRLNDALTRAYNDSEFNFNVGMTAVLP